MLRALTAILPPFLLALLLGGAPPRSPWLRSGAGATALRFP
jgi:hypothetical protein